MQKLKYLKLTFRTLNKAVTFEYLTTLHICLLPNHNLHETVKKANQICSKIKKIILGAWMPWQEHSQEN